MIEPILSLSYTLDTIDEAVSIFWNKLNSFSVIAFSGSMGAGKTTFIHHLCDFLEVEDTVSSPTFALVNEYHFFANGEDKTIIHTDWYRLKNAADAVNSGMEDCLIQARRGDCYCFIEWPEKAQDILTGNYVWVAIETPSETERHMTVSIINS